MSVSRQIAYRGAQLACLAAAALLLVGASGPWTVVATEGQPARALWSLGAMATLGVLLAVAGALAGAAGFSPGRGDAEAAGLGVLAAAGTVLGTGLAFLALTRSGPTAVLPTTIRIQPVTPEPFTVGESTFPVAGRLLVVATGTVVVLAAALAVRARNLGTYGVAARPRSSAAFAGPVAVAAAVVGSAAVLIGASVLPWRATSDGSTATVWSAGPPVAAGAVLVVVAGVVTALSTHARRWRPSGAALGAVVSILAGAVGGALLVADRLPGIRPGDPYRDLLLRETTPPLELFAAIVAVLGGTTLVVAAGLALFAATAAPDPEAVDVAA